MRKTSHIYLKYSIMLILYRIFLKQTKNKLNLNEYYKYEIYIYIMYIFVCVVCMFE